jgi:pimeloyl-ACP methyl ester carboxylesterase
MRAFRYPPAEADLRYYDLPGREPAVVWIHGLGASGAQSFVDVARSTALGGRRSLIPDLLGFGLSDRPESICYSMEEHANSVAGLLGALDLGDTVLVGHSMGGAIALLVAARPQSRVVRVVLAEAHLDPAPGTISGFITQFSEGEYARFGHARLLQEAAADPSVPVGYVGSLGVADPVAMHRSARSLVAPRSPTFRDLLYALRIPRTFLVGERNAADPDVAELPRHGVPVRVIRGAGHDMMADNPSDFAAAVATAVE